MILACQKIEKAFGGKSVLNNVNFLINEGEKAAVIGINGAGKTTLLKSLLENMRQTTEKLFSRKALPTVIYLRLLM